MEQVGEDIKILINGDPNANNGSFGDGEVTYDNVNNILEVEKIKLTSASIPTNAVLFSTVNGLILGDSGLTYNSSQAALNATNILCDTLTSNTSVSLEQVNIDNNKIIIVYGVAIKHEQTCSYQKP